MPLLSRKIRVAVQGCSHGNLDAVYATLQSLEAKIGVVDILLMCGDFQAVRNRLDLDTLHCPQKYRRMGDFSKYYSGLAKAPLLTVFIGGNHEAASHMWELYHGGWVAPNIYYMGHAGVIRVGDLRIGGISGIHSDNDAALGYEPLDAYGRKGHIRTEGAAKDQQHIHGRLSAAYHTRQWEIERLHQLQTASLGAETSAKLDIFLSHEWPHSVYEYGNVGKLLERKPFFRSDLAQGAKGIGSKPLAQLLSRLKPRNWYAGHMHADFEATVMHTGLESDQSEERSKSQHRSPVESETRFVALDKCLPGRAHLKIFDIHPSAGTARGMGGKKGIERKTKVELRVEYDREWLSIVRAYNPYMPIGRHPVRFPSTTDLRLEENRRFVQENVTGSLEIPGLAVDGSVVSARTGDLTGTDGGSMQNARYEGLLESKMF
eukprot:gene28041-36948_t